MKYEYNKINIYHPKLEELEEQGKAVLEGYGFNENNIIKEYCIDDRRFIVDIAGITEKYKVGVELGKCSADKLFALKTYFDVVVWLPYWLTEIKHKSPISIENQINYLKNDIETKKEDIVKRENRIKEIEQKLRNLEKELREVLGRCVHPYY